MKLKKAYMANKGRYCSNCANCNRTDGVSIKNSDCESPRLLKTVYDCEHGKIKKMQINNCRNVYGTMKCEWSGE